MATEAIVPDLEVDAGQSSGEQEPQGTENQTTEADPYSKQGSREYTQWLKSLREAPENARFARIAKDNHFRLSQLMQMEPKGLDGVREKYALFDSITHGELKGVEALGAIQDELRSVAEVDELLAAGDPRALEALGDEFNEGLAKLTPTILDRVRESNPEAYNAAVLPHFVEALRTSPLVSDFNGVVDALEEEPPAWLNADQKGAWAQDRMGRVVALVARMGKWLNAQAEHAKKDSPDPKGAKAQPKQNEREQNFEKSQRDHHWRTNIQPGLDKHAQQKFAELFRPYAKRLRLDSTATQALRQAFISGVVDRAKGNRDYMSQIERYRAARNPDPSSVLNYAKVEFDKHAEATLKALVNERYKPFLNGRPQSQPAPASVKRPPVSPGVQITTVKPASADIDFRRTPIDWIHQRKYMLKTGKVVQVRQ